MLVNIVVVLVLCQVASFSHAGVIVRANKNKICSQLYQPCKIREDCCSNNQICHPARNRCEVRASDPGGRLRWPAVSTAKPTTSRIGRIINFGCGVANFSCTKKTDCCATFVCNHYFVCIEQTDSADGSYDNSPAGIPGGSSPAGIPGNNSPAGIPGSNSPAGIPGVIGGANKKKSCSPMYHPCETREDCCSNNQYCHPNAKRCVARSAPGGALQWPAVSTRPPLGEARGKLGCGIDKDSCTKKTDCCATFVCNHNFICAKPTDSGGGGYIYGGIGHAGVPGGHSPGGFPGYPPVGLGGPPPGGFPGYPPVGLGGPPLGGAPPPPVGLGGPPLGGAPPPPVGLGGPLP